MEYDRESPYYALTRDQVKEKMKKQIDELSQVFCLSKSDATVLLMSFRWDSLCVSERLVDNGDNVLSASGLKSVDPNRDSSDISCRNCLKIEFDGDGDDAVGDYLISTPFCSHKFCKACWREYLDKNFYSVEKIQTAISCRGRDCGAAVGPDTIEKLTVADQEMYESYILRSYLEGNHGLGIKQCPAPDCNYAIEFHGMKGEEECGLNVVCLCGHTFCWRCRLESHRPVTCNNASDWLSRDSRASKSCPHCLRDVDLGTKQYLLFLTCACSGRFCWKCMQSEEDHKTEAGFYKLCDVERRVDVDNSCVKHWEASQVSMEQAKLDLQAFEASNIKNPGRLNEKDVRIFREGLMLIVQCRQVLKWICVYDYFHAEYEISKREYLRFLQGNATAIVENYSKTLKEEIQRALSVVTSEKFNFVGDNVSMETSNIGNYFYHFIKTLQDGLDDVKVKSYDNFGGPFWLCDRCTFGNTWFHKECNMCRDATALPVELSHLSFH